MGFQVIGFALLICNKCDNSLAQSKNNELLFVNSKRRRLTTLTKAIHYGEYRTGNDVSAADGRVEHPLTR